VSRARRIARAFARARGAAAAAARAHSSMKKQMGAMISAVIRLLSSTRVHVHMRTWFKTLFTQTISTEIETRYTQP
jgi:hypothetical protein